MGEQLTEHPFNCPSANVRHVLSSHERKKRVTLLKLRHHESALQAEANRHAVSICVDVVDHLPQITADRVQLQQVLMNLLLRAIEVMNEIGGVLTVKSRVNDKEDVQISVNDTGTGLPAGKAEQIFERLLYRQTSR